MAVASYKRTAYRANTRRGPSIALSVAVVALIVLMLLTLHGGLVTPETRSKPLTVFGIALPALNDARHAKTIAPVEHQSAAKAAHATTPKTQTQPKVVPPTPPKPTPTHMIQLSDTDFASSDIGSMAKSDANGTGDQGTGVDASKVYGPGEGPGGATLYRAEWYTEPTDAQLAHYLPPEVPRGAWAEIACKTIDDYHVENCRQLGESPVGSGLARALRLAAWQFLVRPPRVNGHSQVGSWVRIHFDFTREAPAD